MTEDPVTIEPDATVAAGRAADRPPQHNRLPVIEHGRLVGVVTRVDVLEALTRRVGAVALRALAARRHRRDRAQLRALAAAAGRRAAVRGREGRRLRARRASPAARAALAGRRGVARRRDRRGGRASCARPASTGRCSCMGALSAEELAVALAAGADVVAWRERLRSRALAGGADARRARQARHRHGAARHARPRRGARRRRASPARRGAARRRDDPFRHRRRATPAFVARAARALRALGGRDARGHARRARPRGQQRRRAARDRRRASTWCAAASRSTAWTRSRRDPADARARARADARAPTSPRSSRRAGRERGLRPALRRRARRRWLGTLPIGYGDGVRRGLTNNADVLIGGRRVPLVGTVAMDNITVTRARAAGRARAREAVLIGAQGDERILAEEVAAPRSARSTTRSPAASRARVPRAYAVTRRPLRAPCGERAAPGRARLARRRRRARPAARAATDDVDLARRRRRRRRPPALRTRTGGAAFPLSEAFGALACRRPASTPGTSTYCRCAAATSSADLARARLHDQRDGRAAGRRRARGPARRRRRPRRAPAARWSRRAALADDPLRTLRAVAAGGASSASTIEAATLDAVARRRPRPRPAWRPSASSPSSSGSSPRRAGARGLELMDDAGADRCTCCPSSTRCAASSRTSTTTATSAATRSRCSTPSPRSRRDPAGAGSGEHAEPSPRCWPSRSPTSYRAAARCASARCCTTSPSRATRGELADGRVDLHRPRPCRAPRWRAAICGRLRASRAAAPTRRRARPPPPAARLPRPRARR